MMEKKEGKKKNILEKEAEKRKKKWRKKNLNREKKGEWRERRWENWKKEKNEINKLK